MANPYITGLELRERLEISDSSYDDMLDSMAEAISRAMDFEFKRRFYTTSADETRYFTANSSEALYPGDIVSITTLKTDAGGDGTFESTWTENTDFYLEPFDADDDGKPFTEIHTAPLGSYKFPVGIRRGVQIVGKFGWPAVPPQARELCFLLASRLYKRKGAIFGVAGASELGQIYYILRNDPEARSLGKGLLKGGALF